MRKPTLSLGLLLFVIGLFFFGPALAQTGCEPTGDGPVDAQKSAVKRVDDTATVSWERVLNLADADCTPIADDPEFALTSYRVYFSVDDPVNRAADEPIATPGPAATSATINFSLLTQLRPGANVYFAVDACNQFGCSPLGNQPWVKLGGPPGKPTGTAVN